MSKHAPHEEHENHERWLYTYADLMNNLLVMFMVLYIMSVVDLGKFERLAAAFAKTFNVTEAGEGERMTIEELSGLSITLPDGTVVTPAPTEEAPGETGSEESNGEEAEASQPPEATQTPEFTGYQPGATSRPGFDVEAVPTTYAALFEKISYLLEENDYEDQVSVEKVADSIYLRFREGVFFYPDSPVLKDGAYPILNSISNVILESYDLIEGIEISGHTAKIVEGKPNKNNLFSWELSTDRALTVLKYIVQQCNVPQEKLSVVGYSSNKLYVEGYEEKFWAQNRRVEIRLSQRDLTDEEQQRLNEGQATPTVQPIEATPSPLPGYENQAVQPSPIEPGSQTAQPTQETVQPTQTLQPAAQPTAMPAGSSGH